MKKILSNTLLIFFIIILLFTLYIKFVKKDKIINFLGYRFLIVLTGSMEPEIKMGSLIIIKEEKNYNVGDIVTYLQEDCLVTHRIAQKDNESIITKGDSNNETDSKFLKEKILGKVVFCSFVIGKFIRLYLKNVIILLTVIIIIFNIVYYIFERKKNGEFKGKKME